MSYPYKAESPRSSLNRTMWSCKLTQAREAKKILSDLTDDVLANLDEKGRKHTTKDTVLFQTNFVHKQLDLLIQLIKKEANQ